MELKKAYHSCFLTDVQIGNDTIRFLDSSKNAYYVDMHNENAVSSFKQWFKQVFMKAIAQNVSIFEYEIRNVDECETNVFIIKFLNVKDDKSILLEENCKDNAKASII